MAADEGDDPVEREADEADPDEGDNSVGEQRAVVAVPDEEADASAACTISAATMASQLMPTPMRRPVNMCGTVAGSSIFRKYSIGLSCSTLPTFT